VAPEWLGDGGLGVSRIDGRSYSTAGGGNRIHDPKPSGTPEEEFEVMELKKNALDPTRQFVFQ
jgi:hypothetical protein